MALESCVRRESCEIFYALQGKSHLCIPSWELRDLGPSFHIHVSFSDLYIPGSVHIFPNSRIGRPILEIYKFITGRQNIIILFWK